MTDKRNEAFRRKCAEIEGYTFDNSGCFPSNTIMRDANGIATHKEDLPTYDNDADLDRVIRLLSDSSNGNELARYIDTLCEIVNRGWGSQALATAAQKREALMRVLVGEDGE